MTDEIHTCAKCGKKAFFTVEVNLNGNNALTTEHTECGDSNRGYIFRPWGELKEAAEKALSGLETQNDR